MEEEALVPEIVDSLEIKEEKGEIEGVRDDKGRWVPGKRPPGAGRKHGVLNKLTREQHKMQLAVFEALNKRSNEIENMPINQLLAAGVSLTPKDAKLTLDVNSAEKIILIRASDNAK